MDNEQWVHSLGRDMQQVRMVLTWMLSEMSVDVLHGEQVRTLRGQTCSTRERSDAEDEKMAIEVLDDMKAHTLVQYTEALQS